MGASDDLNYCWGAGHVVGPGYDLPDDPAAYCGDDRGIVGCNSLVCGTCHARVRHLLGRVPEAPPGTRSSTVYDTEDLSTLGWLRPSSLARWYLCRCSEMIELHARPCDVLAEMSGLQWQCAGHPAATFPLDLEGHEITRFTDIRKLLSDAATWTIKLPISRIYARLRGTPLQAEVERVIQTFLIGDDPALRRAALGFYFGHPVAPGSAHVLTLAEGDRALFRGVPDETLHVGTDLEARLIFTLGQLWISGTVDEDRARILLRNEAKKPGRLRAAVAALAQKDTKWLMQHAEELLGESPDQTGKLIAELHRVLGPAAELLELARRARPANDDARAVARTDVESYVTSDLRDPLLAILA